MVCFLSAFNLSVLYGSFPCDGTYVWWELCDTMYVRMWRYIPTEVVF